MCVSLPTCQKILCSADHALPLYSPMLDRKDWTKNKSQRGEDLLIIFLLVCSTLLVVQSLSHLWLFVIPWSATYQASLSFTISQSLLKLISIESVMSSNHFILSPSSPFAFNLSQHQYLFQWVGSCTRWPKYWSFSISLSNEYSGLISFRIDWFDLPADQGIVRNLSLLSLPACDINHIVHSRSGRII